MWNNIRVHIATDNQISFIQICNLCHQLGLKYYNFNIVNIGHIFIIHPHAPTDRISFQGIQGVTLLEHPHHPENLSSGTLQALNGHIDQEDSAHAMWLKIFAIHAHPALHPDT